LAEAGASVVIADLDGAGAGQASAALDEEGLSARPFPIDVADESKVKAVFEFATREFGCVDIVVNNAGIFPQATIREMSAKAFDRVIAVNLRGLYLCTKYGAEAIIEQGRGGKIINITSIDALHPSMVGLAHYDASKHGAWGFTKNAALEYAPHGIAVNAIAPGGVATPGVAAMSAGAGGAAAEAMLDAFLQRIPMRRMGEPDEIGKVALFLASEMASYITGTQIVVDGGALLA
jgi:2-deoxy-D-gluconate 3-dehydrogenase